MNAKPWTQLWLDYKKVNSKGNEAYVKSVSLEGFDAEAPVIKNALKELKSGVWGMLGMDVFVKETADTEAALRIVKQTASADLEGAYRLVEESGKLILLAGEESGVLYGVFHILRMIATQTALRGINITQSPSQPLRMINHWDNMDGSIERGYSGRSF